MSVRRLFAVAIAVAWLLPTAMAGAIALHLVFEHHSHDLHGASSHRTDLHDAAENGYVHSPNDAPHHHSAGVTSVDAMARRTVDSKSIQSRSAETVARAGAALDAALERRVRIPLEPPRASGPPLLARLSTLRI